MKMDEVGRGFPPNTLGNTFSQFSVAGEAVGFHSPPRAWRGERVHSRKRAFPEENPPENARPLRGVFKYNHDYISVLLLSK